MPLSAVVHDEIIIGPDLSREAWDELKREHKKGLPVIMKCCGANGHLRISKHGLQHFYHPAHSEPCNWKHESLAHLEIKNEIYQICKKAKWDTDVEYISPDGDWIADVYAQDGDKKIVFEVQLSKIHKEELKERNLKYVQSGIESYWILKNKSKYRLKDYLRFKGGLGDLRYLDDYFSTVPGCENPNVSDFFMPQEVIAIDIDLETRSVMTGIESDIGINNFINSVLSGEYQSNLAKNVEKYEYYSNLRQIAGPILEEVHDSHMRIITLIHELKHQYAIFKNNSFINYQQIKDNFRVCYDSKEEMSKFFFGVVLNTKLGWKWINSEYSHHIEHVLHLTTSDQILEIRGLSKEAPQKINAFEKNLAVLTHEIRLNMKSEKQQGTHEERFINSSPTIIEPRAQQITSPISQTIPMSEDFECEEPFIPREKSSYFKQQFEKKQVKVTNSETQVKFEANNDLIDVWLTASDGIKYQVIPGLPVVMNQTIAKEFEQRGFGRICSK